ncbi:hypothetical protein [Prosthecomicrobium pneumaticum]|uniref:Uncharacterized protein n=1 Tax=Prosthecomicrobium pneumaticum TaxID=81895 RepID=A0A7W9CVD6_9HYPH|nr:hypothetical protein [Prosthecomicrobium pneumaticum]MBB5752625.1 hypothetical protein [Prosthecomicrobium pneumaticum]
MGDLRIRGTDEEGARRLARLVVERAPGLACGACGGREFAILEQPDAGLRTWLRREGQPFAAIDTKISQPLVTLVCITCGHLEQFAEATLEGADASLYGEVIAHE